jgi:hypothetical protein
MLRKSILILLITTSYVVGQTTASTMVQQILEHSSRERIEAAKNKTEATKAAAHC